MAEAKAPVLVVLQLTGGNDYLNTVIPYTDANYRDYRPSIGIPEDDILRLDDQIGLHPSMGPTKELYEKGEVAVIHGVGYANSSRSHFRSMDIWHTCEPEKVGTEGWLGRVIRDLDPKQENPVTGINFGYDLPRAMAAPGVPVACVVDLATYGLLPGVTEPAQRVAVLDRFKRLYSPAIGTGPAMNYLAQTALQGMDGADILKVAPQRYSSTVEYANNPPGPEAEWHRPGSPSRNWAPASSTVITAASIHTPARLLSTPRCGGTSPRPSPTSSTT